MPGQAYDGPAVQDSPALAVPFPATAGTVGVFSGDCVLVGLSMRETTGTAPALAAVFDGVDGTGTRVLEVALSPGQSVRESYGSPGVYLRSGAAVVAASGSVVGTLWVRDL